MGVGKGEGLEKEKNFCPRSIPDLMKYNVTLSRKKAKKKLQKLKRCKIELAKPKFCFVLKQPSNEHNARRRKMSFRR